MVWEVVWCHLALPQKVSLCLGARRGLAQGLQQRDRGYPAAHHLREGKEGRGGGKRGGGGKRESKGTGATPLRTT